MLKKKPFVTTNFRNFALFTKFTKISRLQKILVYNIPPCNNTFMSLKSYAVAVLKYEKFCSVKIRALRGL